MRMSKNRIKTWFFFTCLINGFTSWGALFTRHVLSWSDPSLSKSTTSSQFSLSYISIPMLNITVCPTIYP